MRGERIDFMALGRQMKVEKQTRSTSDGRA
jgi:hypothetical protein